MRELLGAFFNSFRKGPVICRGLDLDLSGKVAKKRLWHGLADASHPRPPLPPFRVASP